MVLLEERCGGTSQARVLFPTSSPLCAPCLSPHLPGLGYPQSPSCCLQGRLPVKWMAPEALFDRIYTHQSDV